MLEYRISMTTLMASDLTMPLAVLMLVEDAVTGLQQGKMVQPSSCHCVKRVARPT